MALVGIGGIGGIRGLLWALSLEPALGGDSTESMHSVESQSSVECIDFGTIADSL